MAWAAVGGQISAAHGLGGGHSLSSCPWNTCVPGTALFKDSKIDNKATLPALAELSPAGGTQAPTYTDSFYQFGMCSQRK